MYLTLTFNIIITSDRRCKTNILQTVPNVPWSFFTGTLCRHSVSFSGQNFLADPSDAWLLLTDSKYVLQAAKMKKENTIIIVYVNTQMQTQSIFNSQSLSPECHD